MKRPSQAASSFLCSVSLPILMLSMGLLAGCARQAGPVLETVQGTATFDGKPIEEGEILFRPEDPTRSGGGGKITKGEFRFQSPVGAMRVEINAYRVVPGKFIEANPGEKDPVREQYIPEQFNQKTTLTATVDSQHREFKFDLLSEKK